MRYMRKTLVIVMLLVVLLTAFPASALAHHTRHCCPRPPKVVVPRHPPRPHYQPYRPHYTPPRSYYHVPVKKPPAHSARVYIVKRGDTLSHIARRFGTSVRALQAANPHVKNANVIRVGQRLIIPW
jgi:nucleoid-associated protein YgaU